MSLGLVGHFSLRQENLQEDLLKTSISLLLKTLKILCGGNAMQKCQQKHLSDYIMTCLITSKIKIYLSKIFMEEQILKIG